jgi:ATP-dependent helicase/nuclease subunit A
MAYDYEQENGPDTMAFTEHLLKLLEDNLMEPDIALEDQGEDLVRIYTVHKAKGLEYPMIILPDLSRSLKQSSANHTEWFNLTTQGYLGLNAPASFFDQKSKDKYRSWTYEANKQTLNQREEAEALRALYVACTRAKDELVFLGLPPADGKGQSWGSWLASTQAFAKVADDWAHAPVDARKINDFAAVHKQVPKAVEPKESNKEVSPFGLPVHLSITKLLQYLRCPYAYKQSLVRFEEQGVVSEDVKEALESSKADQTRRSAKDFGSNLHSLLEKYDFKRGLDEQWPNLLAQQMELTTAEQHELKNSLRKLERMPQLKQLAQSKLLRELNMTFRLDEHLLTGTADVVAWSDADSYQLIDYKTGHLPLENPEQYLVERGYYLQQQLYAHGLEKLYGHYPDKVQLWFVEDGRVVDVDTSPEALNKARHTALRALEDLRQGHFPKHEHSHACRFCAIHC